MMDAKFDGADFSGARLAANMSRASFVNARFDGANLSRYGRMQAFRAIFRRPARRYLVQGRKPGTRCV